MDRLSIYVETSIVSYLAARRSRNLLTAAYQEVTTEWWEWRRGLYELYTSALVVAEAGTGDSDAAAKRLEYLRGVIQLTASESAESLAVVLVARGALPPKAEADALHIAIAAVHGVDFLLTWNCRHIDNPTTKPIVRAVCLEYGYSCPEICTPVEMMEAYPDA